ncbi:MAG: pentapeptide repeat-containing protein [Gammaproteobacteria bacterium]
MGENHAQRVSEASPAGGDSQWFVRRGDQVRGPYRWSTIEMNLALGRIRANDEVCLAGPGWQPLDALRPAAPVSEVPRRAARTPLAARRERAASAWASLHEPAAPHPRIALLAVAVLALAIGTALLAHLATPVPPPPIDCAAPPANGVNWDFCALTGTVADGADLRAASARNVRLRGASLVDATLAEADLAYADLAAANLTMGDLRGTRLVGANLREAVLHHADLRDSDLRFADLSGVSLRGALLDGARLDNAIWPDGRICASGSRGACRAR